MSGELQIPDQALVWPSSVFSLVTGAFLLPFGRIADIYGGFIVFSGGLTWYLVWTLIAGFSQNYHMLIATRALQGLGPAAFLPATMMILAKTYRPGPRKNLIFGLCGAFAPLGFYLGIIMAGITSDLLSWRWYFWIGSIIIFAVCIGGVVSIPRDMSQTVGGDMDHWGVATIVPALILIVFAVTDGPYATFGWKTDYIIIALVLGVVLLGASIFIEGWIAAQPLLPGSLFRQKYMKTLVVALTFAYGTYGIFMYYASF